MKNQFFIALLTKNGNNATIKFEQDRDRKVTKQKAPEKLTDVLKKIRACIEQGKYQFSKHALDRVVERGIDIQTTKNVLLNGYEEKRKTKFDKENNKWKYAIRGTTIDGLPVRIIVAIDEYGALIITVMHVL